MIERFDVLAFRGDCRQAALDFADFLHEAESILVERHGTDVYVSNQLPIAELEQARIRFFLKEAK